MCCDGGRSSDRHSDMLLLRLHAGVDEPRLCGATGRAHLPPARHQTQDVRQGCPSQRPGTQPGMTLFASCGSWRLAQHRHCTRWTKASSSAECSTAGNRRNLHMTVSCFLQSLRGLVRTANLKDCFVRCTWVTSLQWSRAQRRIAAAPSNTSIASFCSCMPGAYFACFCRVEGSMGQGRRQGSIRTMVRIRALGKD